MSEHAGHRRRIIQKLDKEVLEEHELLEVLLFNALPRRNTNDLAHRLLARFGSIKEIFDATVYELSQVEGIGESVAAYLVCIGKFYKKYYAPAKESLPLRYQPEEFLAFVKTEYANLPHEVMDFYLLDKTGKILKRKRFSNVTAHQVTLNPAEITKYLLEQGVEGLVVAHNHPTGSPTPSKQDDEATTCIQVLCSTQNLLFCDHVIYADGGVYSYYKSGRMKNISTAYSMRNILKGGQGGNNAGKTS